MGTGTIATEHMVGAIRAIGHSPLWIVSRSERDAAAFADDLEIPKLSTDLAQALQDPLVAFAYISAAVNRRPHYISAAASAGKHILCDGPIASTSKIAAAMLSACREAGVRLAVHQPLRSSSIHQTMRRLIADGEVGEVQSVLVLRGGLNHLPPYRRTQIPDDPEQIQLAASVECIDLVRFLTGAELTEVNALARLSGGVMNQLAYSARLDSGAIVQIHESFLAADLDSMVLIAGDRGALLANGTLHSRASGTLVRRSAGKSEQVPLRERDPYLATVSDLVNAQKQGPSWLAQGEDCLTALVVAEALAISVRKNRSVAIRDGGG